MKLFLQAVFFLFLSTLTTQGQRICGATAYKEAMLKADPSLTEVFTKIENQIIATVNNKNVALRDTSSNEIIFIPVVIHLLYKNAAENISDAQIKSQLDVLNKDFNMLNSDRANTPQAFKGLAGDAKIQFCLARVDTEGRSTSGIDRKYTNQDLFTTDDEMKMVNKGGAASWDSKRYLNIWVCRLSSRSLGYATPPGAAADVDGIVMAYDVFGTTGTLRAPFNKGRTATHEVAHWLGLIHIWGDASCGDDHVADTPPQQSYNFGCPTFPKVSNCSKDNNGDMFMNFMDFSDDACMNMFTKGQVKRMRALFAQGNLRNSFLSSSACDSLVSEAAPLPALPVSEEVVKLPAVSLASLKVYPNPVNGVTTIECKGATELTAKTLRIFNGLGINIFTTRLIRERTTINLSNLKPGIYIAQIGDGQDKSTLKIIKQ
ncbi:MAG: M43 family zinc metalloprotease [Ferruginibacter sp.]